MAAVRFRVNRNNRVSRQIWKRWEKKPTSKQHLIFTHGMPVYSLKIFWSKFNIFRNFPETFCCTHLRKNCLGLYFVPTSSSLIACLLLKKKKWIASAFHIHFILSSALKPTQGAGSPATSPKAQFPYVLSWGVAFWKAEDAGKLSWSAPLSLAGVILPCTPEARLEANNQEQEQPKQPTSVCCTLKNMSLCQSR